MGELEAVADDGSVLSVRGGKLRALLALLALHRGEPVGADRLIDALWGDEPPGNPTNALQALIANLRRALGAAAVTTTDAGYSLSIESAHIDVVRFEQLVAQGRHDLDSGDLTEAADRLRKALALRRGEPLAEFAFAEFAQGERARLEELTFLAIEGRVEAELGLGQHGELVGELEALCVQHPLRERLWELRMLALYRSGRQADALRVYSDARERLIDELGLEPGPGLRELERRVLAQDPGLDAPTPERASVPTRNATGNLRERLTTFVGRQADIERLIASLEAHRLVTLIGPGGSGKTRLAVEVAARLQPECADGAWFVELAGVRDADGVTPAVYAALKAGDSASADPERMADPISEQLVRHLDGRSIVVVLDNCEHVIAEAAALTEMLTSRLPDLRLIATSREALAVPGETLIPIGGLDLDAAVQMFEDRAPAVRVAFTVDESNRTLVEDVCRRLDCLPLALELASARLRALPLAQLAERLDDRFRVLTGGARTALPRQQTLRAVVDWSYDLLFEDERRLFARLSVFTGGFDLEAAEHVCSDEVIDQGDICDLLLHLVDKSLVIAEVRGAEARYMQLQTLWQYGRERLAESKDADACRDRHSHWYLDLATRARPGLRGRTGPGWRSRIDADFDNLRAALDWFAANDDASAALALVDGIAWNWFARNDPHEATRWLGDALAVAGEAPEELRAMVVAWRVYFGAPIFGLTSGRDDLDAALEMLRTGDDPRRLADALMIASELMNRNNDAEGSQAAADEVQPLLHALDDEWGLAIVDSLMSRNLMNAGDLDGAADAARASVARLKSIGEEWMVFEGLGVLAVLLEVRGDLEGAAEAYEELMAQGRDQGLPMYETQWTIRLAAVRARQGDDCAAEQHFRDFIASGPVPNLRGWALIGLAGARRRQGDLDEAKAHLDEALAVYEGQGADAGRAAAFIGLCWWAIAVGDLDAAAKYAGRAHECAAADTDVLITLAAETAVVAVAVVVAGGDPDLRLDAVVARRAQVSGRYDMLIGGPIGAALDEPDVAALVATLA